ncbi:MAG: D-aminoacyl-tRNA deacylase [Dehalococcoidia bacterium]|nr:D-aminoacyl-tRNA deacylase [Dehalococcoidia bacterium]
MKALVQRVSRASVSVNNNILGKIGRGLVVFLGVAQGDSKEDATYLANKAVNLRIFADEASKFSLSSLDTRGDILIVSQFTLLADTHKGRRPDFTYAAPPDLAKELYEFFVDQVRATGLRVETGLFQEHMLVEIYNDGPVTISLESKTRK